MGQGWELLIWTVNKDEGRRHLQPFQRYTPHRLSPSWARRAASLWSSGRRGWPLTAGGGPSRRWWRGGGGGEEHGGPSPTAWLQKSLWRWDRWLLLLFIDPRCPYPTVFLAHRHLSQVWFHYVFLKMTPRPKASLFNPPGVISVRVRILTVVKILPAIISVIHQQYYKLLVGVTNDQSCHYLYRGWGSRIRLACFFPKKVPSGSK